MVGRHFRSMLWFVVIKFNEKSVLILDPEVCDVVPTLVVVQALILQVFFLLTLCPCIWA